MSIIAKFSSSWGDHLVEVLDAYECGGTKYAPVKALEGKPFMGGDKWPVHTEYATASAAQLEIIESKPTPNQPEIKSLYTLAMAAAKPAWSAGESVWIYGQRPKGAFLKESGGFVELCIPGLSVGCPVFFFDMGAWQWRPIAHAQEQYNRWVNVAKAELERRSK